MKPISNNFKLALNKFGREFKNKINVYDYLIINTENDDWIITENGNDLIAKTSDTDIEFELNDDDLFSIKVITKGEMLSTLMKELDFESFEDLEVGRIIDYRFGIKTSENLYEYINYGKFIIYKKEYDEVTKTYLYTCYDFMLKTMRQIGSEFFYIGDSANGEQILKTICEILTIDFDDSVVDGNNKPTEYGMIGHKTQSIFITLLLQNKLTYRDLLDLLCKYFGVSMYIENNNLKIKLLGNIEYNESEQQWFVNNQNPKIVDTISEEYLKDKNVTFQKKYGKINALELTGIDESKQQYIQNSESVSTNGLTMYSIQNNLLLNNTQVWNEYGGQITNDIFELINGVEYELNDISTNGILFLDWLDFYNIQINNVIHKCLLLNSEITIKSGIQENIYTEIPNEDIEEYTTSDSNSSDVIANTIRARGNSYATNFEATGRINAQALGPDLEKLIKKLIQEIFNTL